MPRAEGSLSELGSRLEFSFRTSTRLLRRLLAGLQERRTAWVSARPAAIAPPADLEAIAAELQVEDRDRASLLAELAALLPLPAGVAPAALHVNVSLIAGRLPRNLARDLRAAADEATAVARSVRRELALGTRLLGFAQRAHDGLLAEAVAAARQASVPGYDRNARSMGGTGKAPATGTLVDGRI
ncbi:MAG: hypothetical protein U1E73_01290 [Planctomycetota bacterium]